MSASASPCLHPTHSDCHHESVTGRDHRLGQDGVSVRHSVAGLFLDSKPTGLEYYTMNVNNRVTN